MYKLAKIRQLKKNCSLFCYIALGFTDYYSCKFRLLGILLERGLSMPCEGHLEKLIDLLGLLVEQKIAESELLPTFPSTVKSELIRILSAGVMIAV